MAEDKRMFPAKQASAPRVRMESFEALRERARELGACRVAVVVADDDIALTAIASAFEAGIARPILVGDTARITQICQELALQELLDAATLIHELDPLRAADTACAMAGRGEIDVLLKGHLRTDQLLKALLNKEHGLRTGQLLSDVLLYLDRTSGSPRLVGITDGGINVLPTLEQKQQIIQNAAGVLRSLGIPRPKMAIMSATEVVTEAVPSTVDARALTEMGCLCASDECEIFGPLALDNALLESAARAKGIVSTVAGFADCLVVPNIEAGNLLGKAVKYLGGSACGHVVVGAKVPVLIPSRVESAEDKLNSIALGVIAHAG